MYPARWNACLLPARVKGWQVLPGSTYLASWRLLISSTPDSALRKEAEGRGNWKEDQDRCNEQGPFWEISPPLERSFSGFTARYFLMNLACQL